MTSPGSTSDFSAELRFQQYKLIVESIEHNSDRREHTQHLYTTIHTSLLTLLAIVAGYGLLTGGIGGSNLNFPGTGFLTEAQAPIIMAVSALGLILCVVWRLHLNAFRRLSSAKFAVINVIEQDLPYKAFQLEWANLKEQKHIDLTAFEQTVPLISGLLYLVLAGIYGAFAVGLH
jgi:hypothetical protein